MHVQTNVITLYLARREFGVTRSTKVPFLPEPRTKANRDPKPEPETMIAHSRTLKKPTRLHGRLQN